MTRILAIIPARGGSKGVVRKNIRELGGKPLIAHTIETAKGCALLTDVIVSTDDWDIAAVSEEHGADIPFLRPASLATDTAKSVDVCLHALDYLGDTGKDYDYLVLLQPTSPLRSLRSLNESIELLLRFTQAPSLITVTPVGNMHPNYMYCRSEAGGDRFEPLMAEQESGLRRQEFRDYYYRNGAIYITKVEFVRSIGKLYDATSLAYVMPEEESINIDSEFDLFLAEQILQYRTKARQ